MPPIVNHCPICEKRIFEPINFGDSWLLECGHFVEKIGLKQIDNPRITSADGTKTLFPYQQSDLKLIEDSGCRSLLTYECGLGKTITSAFTLKNHLEELSPILIIAKSAVLANWERELNCVLGDSILPIWLVNGKCHPIPGMPIHIISFDMLRRLTEPLKKYKFKTLIIDECQHIKDMRSARTKSLQEIAANAKHILALSATPIKNHAAEYFPILNILQPERYPIFDRFIREDCVSFRSGYGYKVGGLRNPERFYEKT
ncbi:MAG: DEAD/DEAH box helicase family protein, partial [Patescibacteria group bacterium]|nr:DEAD/DEAH box helicase family protein [Patescibacteria group bacterium]